MTGLFNEYILTDQVTGQNWALSIFEGELYWAVTGLPSNGDPILQDGTTFWDLGMSDGLLEWSATTVPTGTTGDLVYFTDAFNGAYWQLLIQGGELLWQVVTVLDLGGSSGPINPYDYINIFTEEKFERKIVVAGQKKYLVGIELGFEGSKSFYDGTTLKVAGNKKLKFKEGRSCRGDKKYPLNERRNVVADKSFNHYTVLQLQGDKHLNLTESRQVVGSRDITNILEALDLV